ncbi:MULTISPECIES: response regulator transcription factor [Streptomyces]|uniref:response regulator transcription factor n=1 Tax=Streptomyces TaxID=1883 RepID=UPI00293117D3|nr:response regulator transcription factor [Streptomyces sp. NEAU-HV9]
MSVRVLVVDDQELVREGLVMLLERASGVDVVGSAADGHQALAFTQSLRPDIVLMDLRMPRMDGIEATQRILSAHPGVAVLALTTYPDDRSLFAALRAGARGYLTKDATVEEIVAALNTVVNGGTALATTVQGRVVAVALGSDSRHDRASHDRLTTREAEVLSSMADGMRNEQIADHLGISVVTVKTHINHIFAKLGVVDRGQAVAYAYRTGLAPRAN